MEYMILIYGDESAWPNLSEAQLKAMYAEYGVYTQDLIKAGAMRAGSALKPASTATTVRLRGGKVLSTDGPFAETKEQLGGYYLIDVPDLDAAVKWASKCPGAKTGSCEVRPLAPSPKQARVLGRIVDELARREGARILAGLIGRLGGNFDLAEDCLQDAYERALNSWPSAGIPEKPAAWLTTVAKRCAGFPRARLRAPSSSPRQRRHNASCAPRKKSPRRAFPMWCPRARRFPTGWRPCSRPSISSSTKATRRPKVHRSCART